MNYSTKEEPKGGISLLGWQSSHILFKPPPVIMYNKAYPANALKNRSKVQIREFVPGSLLFPAGSSSTGRAWMNQSAWRECAKHLMEYKSKFPASIVIWVYGDAGSHTFSSDPALYEKLKKNSIWCIKLAGQTTSLQQPLDAGGFFRSFKTKFRHYSSEERASDASNRHSAIAHPGLWKAYSQVQAESRYSDLRVWTMLGFCKDGMDARRTEVGVMSQRLFSRLTALQQEVFGNLHLDKHSRSNDSVRPILPVKTPFTVKSKAVPMRLAESRRSIKPGQADDCVEHLSADDDAGICEDPKQVAMRPSKAKPRSVVSNNNGVVRRNLRSTVGSVWGVRHRNMK